MNRAIFCLAVLLVGFTSVSAPAQFTRGAQQPTTKAEEQQPEATPEAKPLRRAHVKPEEWAPADALLYLGITDLKQTWMRLKSTSGYQLAQETKATGTANPALAIFEAVGQRLAAWLEVPPDQLTNPFAGTLTFYLATPPGAPAGTIEPGLIAQVGEAEAMRRYYDAALAKLAQLRKRETLTAGTHEISSFGPLEGDDTAAAEGLDDEFTQFGSEQGAAPLPLTQLLQSPEAAVGEVLDKFFAGETLPQRFAMCLTEDFLIVAGSTEQVRAVLQREIEVRTLADTEDHQALLSHLKPTGTVRFLINLPQWIAAARAGAQGDTDELRRWLSVLGAESLRSVVGHWMIGASSYDAKLEFIVLMQGERRGLAKLLSRENRPTAPPAYIPTETGVFLTLNADVPRVLDDMDEVLRSQDPAQADAFRAALERKLPDGATINLRRDFLDHLQPPLTLHFALTEPIGPNCVRLLASLGQRDRAAMVRVLSNPAITGLPLMPRDVGGFQVFDVPPMFPVVPAGLAVAASTDRLLAGNTAAVERTLSLAVVSPLAEAPDWQRVARFVPPESWLTFYMDNGKILDASLELARHQDELAGGGMSIDNMIIAGLLQNLNQSTGGNEDQAAVLRKYAAGTIITLSTVPDGVQFTAVQLKPKE